MIKSTETLRTYAKNLSREEDSGIDYEVAYYFGYRIDFYEDNQNNYTKSKKILIKPKAKKLNSKMGYINIYTIKK